jgi:hypothetical protein
MAKNASSERIVTPEFRASFLNVFEKDKHGKYSVVMLFPKQSADWTTDLPWLAALVGEVLKAQYPDASAMPPVFKAPGLGKPWPVRDGDAGSQLGVVTEDHKGHWCVSASSMNFDPARNLLNGVTNELGLMTSANCFSGCYFQAQVHAYFYVNEGVGVSIGLDNLKFVKEGESFGSSSSDAASAFGVAPAQTSAAAAFDAGGGGGGEETPAWMQ